MSRENCYNLNMRGDFIINSELSGYTDKQEGNSAFNISAMATTFGEADRVGEIIDSNAFNASVKAINDGKEKLKILFNHNRDKAVGVWTKAVKTAQGIKLYGRISEATQETKDLLALVRDGVYDKVSIGFLAKDFDDTRSGLRILKGELIECSIVAIPANNNANILSVKEYTEMMNTKEGSVESKNCYNKNDEIEFDNFIKRLEGQIFTTQEK